MFDAEQVVCQARPLSLAIQIVAFRPLAYYRGDGGPYNRNSLDSSLRITVVMGKQLFPKLVYLGALSLLVLVFTLVLLFAAATLLIPTNGVFAFGVSSRYFTIAAVSFFTAVALAVFFVARALQRPRLN